MNLGAFTPDFIGSVRAYIEKQLNYEWSYTQRAMVRKRDRSINDLSQAELPYETVTEILDFADETYYGGYCETCSYEETHCYVTYKLESGETRQYEYSGSFASLINELVEL